MTGLLVVTFVLAGAHTLLWLPRSLQYKRELKKKKAEKNNLKYTDSDTKK